MMVARAGFEPASPGLSSSYGSRARDPWPPLVWPAGLAARRPGFLFSEYRRGLGVFYPFRGMVCGSRGWGFGFCCIFEDIILWPTGVIFWGVRLAYPQFGIVYGGSFVIIFSYSILGRIFENYFLGFGSWRNKAVGSMMPLPWKRYTFRVAMRSGIRGSMLGMVGV